MLTRGEGVKSPENLADVICERPPGGEQAEVVWGGLRRGRRGRGLCRLCHQHPPVGQLGEPERAPAALPAGQDRPPRQELPKAKGRERA